MQWDLVQNLNENESPEWDHLVKNELGESVHADRKKGFCLAREALRLCFRKKGFDLPISDLKVQNFQYLPSHSSWLFSLSHTKDAGVALLASKLVYRSVGIDLELETRLVKDSVAERIANENDLPLDKIKLWCVKEAAFKALMNTGEFSQNIEFSDLAIKETTFTHSPTGLRGEWDVQSLTPFVIARAWIYTKSS